MAQITYQDKVFLNKNEDIPDQNKVNDTDLNEIKNVVNENAILNSLSEIGLSELTTLDAIVTAVPNGKTLQVYLSDDNASTLYGTSGGTGNLPTNIAGLLTIKKNSENKWVYITYKTNLSIYENSNAGLFYTAKFTGYRDWVKLSLTEQVLWTNPNPSGLVDGTYVINLASSDYDELRWIFTYSNTTNNQYSVSCLKGANVLGIEIGYNSPTLTRRIIDYVSDTQYKCRIAMFGESESAEHIIPIAVIGIKR